MKKKIAFLMALVMCGSMFTACGKDDDDSSSSGKKKQKTSVTDTTDDEDEDDEDDEEEETTKKSRKNKKATESTEEDDEDDDDEEETTKSGKKIKLPGGDEEDTTENATNKAEAAVNFKRGTNKNGVYKSEFAGLKFDIPEDWVCATEEEILSMMNLALDVTNNEETFDQELLEQASIYEVYAKGEGGKNIIVAFENMDVSNSLDGASDLIDEEYYFDNMKEQLKQVGGVTYSDISKVEEVEFAGQDFYKLSYTATYDSMGGYSVEQTYYIKKYDQFMLFIVFTSSAECEDMSVYEDNFSAL